MKSALSLAECFLHVNFRRANPDAQSQPAMCQPSALTLALLLLTAPVLGAVTQPRYYAHETRHDSQGVIAPWYQGLNGQCDLRVRIAAETLKRYP